MTTIHIVAIAGFALLLATFAIGAICALLDINP
jgi:hypothetical protein